VSLLLATAGSATTFTYEGTGGLAFSGAAEVSRSITYTASGGIVLAGTAKVSRTIVPQAAGGTTFGGSASTEFVSTTIVATPSGGGGWITRTAGRLSWFAEKSKPKTVAKVFSYSPSGGLRLGGSAPSSFTSSPRLRREESEVAMIMMLLG